MVHVWDDGPDWNIVSDVDRENRGVLFARSDSADGDGAIGYRCWRVVGRELGEHIRGIKVSHVPVNDGEGDRLARIDVVVSIAATDGIAVTYVFQESVH